jgi:hypothetical protein
MLAVTLLLVCYVVLCVVMPVAVYHDLHTEYGD